MADEAKNFGRFLAAVAASGALSILACTIVFFSLSFAIAPADVDKWVYVFFEKNGGAFFLSCVALVAVMVFPFLRRLRVM